MLNTINRINSKSQQTKFGATISAPSQCWEHLKEIPTKRTAESLARILAAEPNAVYTLKRETIPLGHGDGFYMFTAKNDYGQTILEHDSQNHNWSEFIDKLADSISDTKNTIDELIEGVKGKIPLFLREEHKII